MICVDVVAVSCASMQTVQVSAQKSIGVVITKAGLDSYADTGVVGDQCLVICDHNRPENGFGNDPKVGLKHTCIVDTTVA